MCTRRRLLAVMVHTYTHTQTHSREELPAVYEDGAHVGGVCRRGAAYEGEHRQAVLRHAHIRPLRVVVLHHRALLMPTLVSLRWESNTPQNPNASRLRTSCPITEIRWGLRWWKKSEPKRVCVTRAEVCATEDTASGHADLDTWCLQSVLHWLLVPTKAQNGLWCDGDICHLHLVRIMSTQE